jgi:lysophospholipase L1-like esterase
MSKMEGAMKGMLAGGLLALAGCATTTAQPPLTLSSGARYVSLGSSYAAGAGIGTLLPGTPQRCGRTQNNYARLLAARMRFDLIDASCGGATTAHILGPWNELPPQLDAVTPDTELVTITIGGNDVRYVLNLAIATCGRVSGMMPPAGRACPSATWPSEVDYSVLGQRLREIAREVRRRAPQAELIFVDYVRILPDVGGCVALPLDETQMAAGREAFRRLADITAKSAEAEGATLLSAGELSRGHDACSAQPWSAGYPGKPTIWHPTAAGHAGIAAALAERLLNPSKSQWVGGQARHLKPTS